MPPCRYTDLRCKEVINVCDGCRLGCVCDVEVELPEGRVCAIWVPGPWRWLGLFGHDGYYRIPWSCIRRAGDDIILIPITSKADFKLPVSARRANAISMKNTVI